MTPNTIQSGLNDRNMAPFPDPGDSSGYFPGPLSSSMGPSPGLGQKASVDSGSEKISPPGLLDGGGRTVGFADSPSTTAYSTRSEFTKPLYDTAEQMEPMGMLSRPRNLYDSVHTRSARGGHNHASHNSTSFSLQRPTHSSHPSFHSENQFSGRYNGSAADLGTRFDQLRMDETTGVATRRPQPVSHGSLDTSLPQLANRRPSEEYNYQTLQGYRNEPFTPNQVLVDTQPPHYGKRSGIQPAAYTDGICYGGRPDHSNTHQQIRNGFPSNDVGNQASSLHHTSLDAAALSYQSSASMLASQSPLVPNRDYNYQAAATPASYFHMHGSLNRQYIPPGQMSGAESCSKVLAEFKGNHKSGKFGIMVYSSLPPSDLLLRKTGCQRPHCGVCR